MRGWGKAVRAGAATTAALVVLAGCEQKNTYVAPPPPKVTVATPVKRAVTNYLLATGNSAAVSQEIDDNLALARTLGIGGTPSFVVGDRLISGAVGYDTLKQAIAAARAKAS